MKKSFVTLFLSTLFFHSVTQSNQPLPPKSLEERVELATHVIVGTANKVTVLEKREGKCQETVLEPKILQGTSQIAVIEVEVSEVMYPQGWKAKSTLKYIFAGGWFRSRSD